MYDNYGDLMILTKSDDGSLLSALKRGVKRICLRTKYDGEYRVPNLTWISPYKKDEDPYVFLHKENNYYFYGRADQVYYSPRYAEERKRIAKEFKGSISIIGSGIGPFAAYLAPYVTSITEYEPNPLAERYTIINHTLNKVVSTIKVKKYEGEYDQNILSVMPSMPLEYHLNYNFSRRCVIYVNIQDNRLENYTKVLGDHYLASVKHKPVRKYASNMRIHRFTIDKDSNHQSD